MRRPVKPQDKVEACNICRHHKRQKPWSPDLFVLFLYTDFRESCFMLPRELLTYYSWKTQLPFYWYKPTAKNKLTMTKTSSSRTPTNGIFGMIYISMSGQLSSIKLRYRCRYIRHVPRASVQGKKAHHWVQHFHSSIKNSMLVYYWILSPYSGSLKTHKSLSRMARHPDMVVHLVLSTRQSSKSLDKTKKKKKILTNHQQAGSRHARIGSTIGIKQR